MRAWKARNPQKVKAYTQAYVKKHRESIREKRHAKYCRTKERVRQQTKEWRQKNLEHYSAWNARYRKRPDVLARNRSRFRKRKASDPNFALAVALSASVARAIKTQVGRKAAKSIKLLGCSIRKARKHIESQFQKGMSWENFGTHGWHIDHIVPCYAFDLRIKKNQYKCFHYTNLRPLWASDNIRKGATVPGELPLHYRYPNPSPVDTSSLA